MGERAIRVVVADGHKLFRDAATAALEAEPDIEVAATAANGLEAVAEAERHHADVVLIERDLAGGDGIQTTYMVKENFPDTAVVLIAPAEDAKTVVEAIEAGASAFLVKTSPLTELIEVIRAVARGEARVPPALLAPLIAGLQNRRQVRDQAHRRLARLTNREREVLALLSLGADNDKIAAALYISPQTARTHIQKVLGKLGVHSRLEAAAFINRNDMIEELGIEKR